MKESDRKAVVQEVDRTPFPVSNDRAKYASLINILKGYEEFILNTTGTIISSNLEVVNVTGYDEWEVIGKSISIFYTQEDRDRGLPDTDLAQADREGQVITTGWRVKKKNASFWAKVKLTALHNSVGVLTGFGLIIKDATHKALYQYRMKRIRNEYFNLFNNTYTGIFRFRMEDFRVLLFNDKALQILGKTENRQLHFHQVFANAKAFENFIQILQSNKRAQSYEFLIHHRGTHDRWAAVSCRHFEDGDFVEGILIDITEKKVQMLELERLNYELDQFIYHASHDLRSPLTSILGLVNLIEMDEPARVIYQYAQMIKERVNHLDGLLKDLVSITFNNKAGLQPERIDFESEIKSIVQEFPVQNQPVEICVEVRHEGEFYTEPIRLRTILRNLISNALKYHNPHASPPYLKLEVIVKEGKATIFAKDNGIGIDEQYLFQVFEMFYRATTKATGNGLGLYIVKSMIEKLGGNIKIKSSKGLGTEFRIELPTRQ